MNDKAPWQTFKSEPALAAQSLGIAIQLVATIGILLQPFLPESSSLILDSLIPRRRETWRIAGQIVVKPGTRIKPTGPLFHKVSAQKLRLQLEEVRSQQPIEAET